MATLAGKSVVVAGGAGFIGSHLVDAIVEKNPSRIAVLDNFFMGRRENLFDAGARRDDLEVVDLDITDLAALQAFFAARSVDVVFDLATIPLPASLEKPHWSSKEIFELALNMCEMIRLGAFKTLIHCSSSEAYGTARYAPMDEKHPFNTETPYAAGKAAAALMVEAYRRTFGIDMAIGRPFNNFGPRQNGRDFAGIIPRLIQRIMRGETPIIFGDGQQTRDYVYVSDTVRGLISLYENEAGRGQTFNLASGTELSVLEIVREVSRLMGWKEAPRFDPPRPGDVRRHWADTRKAEEILSFRASVPWTEGIERTVSWYRDNPDRLR